VHAICRDLARNGIAAVAPDTDGLDAFIGFITNPAGHWSNAEYGFGILSVGDGASADATAAVSSGLVSSLALVDPTLDQAALGLLTEVAVPVLGCSGREGLAGLEDARAAAPHAEWVVYEGVGAQYWNINAEGYDQVAAEDTRDRVIEFFAESLPVRI
jgi:dienelactone hydrolase